MDDLILTLNKRKIVKVEIPIKLDTIKDKKIFYRKACEHLAKELMSNNAIGAAGELTLDRPSKSLKFWIQTYSKPIDWSRL